MGKRAQSASTRPATEASTCASPSSPFFLRPSTTSAITCNKNGIPFDPLPPVKTSGIRVGSPAGTTRGFGVEEFRTIADMIADVLEGLRSNGHEGNGEVEAAVRKRVRELCSRFPIYQEL